MATMMPPTSDTQDETRCTETRGYCQCDKPNDGHRRHHCLECATHPNGWVFATWTIKPHVRSQDRKHESMHEYANDPWSKGDA